MDRQSALCGSPPAPRCRASGYMVRDRPAALATLRDDADAGCGCCGVVIADTPRVADNAALCPCQQEELSSRRRGPRR